MVEVMWSRSWCLAACLGRSWPPSRRCVHRRPPDAEHQRRSRPAWRSAGDVCPKDGLRMGRRTILAITAPLHGYLRRSGRQDRWQGARAMASIRSEPAKPSAIWGMSGDVQGSRMIRNPGDRLFGPEDPGPEDPGPEDPGVEKTGVGCRAMVRERDHGADR